jgi:hypothetical protein
MLRQELGEAARRRHPRRDHLMIEVQGLEEAFMELTANSAEYHAGVPGATTSESGA